VPIDAMLLDLDGTLLDHDAAAAVAVAQVLAPLVPTSHPGLGETWVRLSHPHYLAWCAGELTFERQGRLRVRDLLAQAGADPRAHDLDRLFADYLQVYEQHWQAFPDALPALRRLHAAGLPVAVLTNGDLALQQRKCDAAGLSPWCGPVLASSVLPAPKPDPRAFLEACRRLDASPQRVLMVGDNLDVDVRGALAAGLAAALLDRQGRQAHLAAGAAPVTVWRSLDEVPDARAPSQRRVPR
jgi:putative hydrolase of the HAD superfamily